MQAEGKQLLTTAQVAGKPLVSFLQAFKVKVVYKHINNNN